MKRISLCFDGTWNEPADDGLMRIILCGLLYFALGSTTRAEPTAPLTDSSLHRIENTPIDQPLQILALPTGEETWILNGKGELLQRSTGDFGESFTTKTHKNVGNAKQVEIAPDGNVLAGIRANGELFVQPLQAAGQEVTLDQLAATKPELLHITADSQKLIVVTKTGDRLTYDLKTRKKIISTPLSPRILQHDRRALEASGRYAVFFDQEQGLVLADALNGMTSIKYKTPEWSVPSLLKLSRDGQYMAVIYPQQPQQFWLWNRSEPQRPILYKQDQTIRDIQLPETDAWGNPPKDLAVILTDGTARIIALDSQNLRVQYRTKIPELSAYQLDFKNLRLQVLDADKKLLTVEQPPLAAMGAPEQPEAFVKIDVNYGTNRSTMNEQEGTIWAQTKILFSSLFMLVLTAIILLPIVVLAFTRPRLAGTLAGLFFLFGLLYLWDRTQAIKKHDLANHYNAEVGKLKFGRCSITIPERRDLGEIPVPRNWLIYEEPANPEKHFILTNLKEMPVAEWCTELNTEIEKKQSQELLIFVHGFNVDFEQAIFRTAQLGVDLKIQGPVFCYSWPSYGLGTHYPNDSTHAEQSAAEFQEFLWTITDKIKADRIHLIAHSMGNRLVCNALKDASLKRVPGLTKIQQVVLAAPDVDKKFFESNYIPNFAAQPPITLYASNHDGALQISHTVNGDPRLGDTRPEIYIHPRLVSIDASDVITGALGHSYFGDERELLMDLRAVFNGVPPLERLGLRLWSEGAKSYWRIQP